MSLCSLPLPTGPATPSLPVGTEPPSYSRSLCGRPGLGKSEVLAATQLPSSEAEGHSLGLAQPLVSGSPGPQQSPLAASVRVHTPHHWDGLPVDTRQLVALGVVMVKGAPI